MTSEPIHLGTADFPTGVLVVIDPGLAHNWDRQGRQPRFDLDIVGKDAEEAGLKYDRGYDPQRLYDVASISEATEAFAGFTKEHGLNARAEARPGQVPHRKRAELSLQARARGIGCFEYTRLWGVCVSGLPVDRGVDIVGIPMPEGEFTNRFRSIDLVVGDLASITQTKSVTGVMVDHGQLGCFDLGVMDKLRARQSRDGLADFIFWGPDAEPLAEEQGAKQLDGDEFGWVDTPVEEIGSFAKPLQDRVKAEQLRVGIDYRPHCPIEMINRQVRTSDSRAGETMVDGLRVAGFDNRWGDGIFTVHRDENAEGELVRVRLDVGSPSMQKRMRQVRLRRQYALISGPVRAGAPPRFVDRHEPSTSSDSGWIISSGEEQENEPDFELIRVGELLKRYPEIAPLIDAPVGARFRLTDDGYQREE